MSAASINGDCTIGVVGGVVGGFFGGAVLTSIIAVVIVVLIMRSMKERFNHKENKNNLFPVSSTVLVYRSTT